MQPIALIDIGINLAHDSYDRDRAEVIARARAAGIVGMIVTGSTLADSARAIALCARWPGILRATAGVHPHHASGFHAPDCARLAELYAMEGGQLLYTVKLRLEDSDQEVVVRTFYSRAE